MDTLLCDAPGCLHVPSYLAPRYRNGDPADGLEWIQLCSLCALDRESCDDPDETPPPEHRIPLIPIPMPVLVTFGRILRDEGLAE